MIPKDEVNFDVIIVGGGPAGSAAACYAAKEGLKVLLLEKEEFPRDKVCGDAVGGKALKHLEELDILKSLEKSPHFVFDSVIFSNTRGEKVKVEAENDKAEIEAEKCAKIKVAVEAEMASVQKDLDAALPLVEKAKKALDGLNVKDF